MLIGVATIIGITVTATYLLVWLTKFIDYVIDKIEEKWWN